MGKPKAPLTPATSTTPPVLYPSFYYNYFRYGLDLLFEGETQRLVKITVHTNIPSHPDFCVYKKCPFVVYTRPKPDATSTSSTPTTPSKDSIVCISDVSNKEDLQIFSKWLPAPVLSQPASRIHPFGVSYFYGFDEGIVFETTDPGYIASVSIFR